jgi:hypothetical protein
MKMHDELNVAGNRSGWPKLTTGSFSFYRAIRQEDSEG